MKINWNRWNQLRWIKNYRNPLKSFKIFEINWNQLKLKWRLIEIHGNEPKFIERNYWNQLKSYMKRNSWKSIDMFRNPSKSMEIHWHPLKSIEINRNPLYENLRNPLKFNEILWNSCNSMEIFRNPWKSKSWNEKGYASIFGYRDAVGRAAKVSGFELGSNDLDVSFFRHDNVSSESWINLHAHIPASQAFRNLYAHIANNQALGILASMIWSTSPVMGWGKGFVHLLPCPRTCGTDTVSPLKQVERTLTLL